MVDELTLIFAGIVSLFAFFLIVRHITHWRFCALCAAVSAIWSTLLILYWLGIFQNLLLIAPLLGASVVGVYYLAEKKTKESLHVFRLPFFLTLLFLTYFLLGLVTLYSELLLLLIFLWLVFCAAYAYRKNPKISKIVERVIACCKDW